MVKIILLCIIVALIGCVQIKYDATTGSFAYSRFGSQELTGLEVEKGIDTTKVSLGKQESKDEIGEQITEILKVLRKVAEKLL